MNVRTCVCYEKVSMNELYEEDTDFINTRLWKVNNFLSKSKTKAGSACAGRGMSTRSKSIDKDNCSRLSKTENKALLQTQAVIPLSMQNGFGGWGMYVNNGSVIIVHPHTHNYTAGCR